MKKKLILLTFARRNAMKFPLLIYKYIYIYMKYIYIKILIDVLRVLVYKIFLKFFYEKLKNNL